MRTLFKWLLIILTGILALLLVALVLLYSSTGTRLSRIYEVTPPMMQIPDQRPTQLDGHQQLIISFCRDCHGPALAGQIIEDNPMVGVIVAPNLTSGKGGIGGSFSDADWLRAIRHGVDPNSEPLLVMPSNVLWNIGAEDLAVVIAYVRAQPPVDNELPELRVGPMGRFLLLQDPSLLPVEVIDHEAPIPHRVEPGITRERGEYLTYICAICHGPDLSGGSSASSGLNLTPAGNLGNWTEADFVNTIRTGTTPEGETFDPIEMPFKQIGLLSTQDLKAIWLYLQSLEPIENPDAPTRAPAY
jgi:Cytochrome c